MKRTLFIDQVVDRDLGETRAAVIEKGRIVEIHIDRGGTAQGGAGARIGQVRRARVTHLNHDVQTATLDAGDGLSLVLRAADARTLAGADAGEAAGGQKAGGQKAGGQKAGGRRASEKPAIAKLAPRGAMLLVQSTRPALDGKQGRCSADIALAGRYLTLRPMRRGMGGMGGAGSASAPDDAALLQRLAPVAASARIDFAPPARLADAEVVAAEAERLWADWRRIDAGADTGADTGRSGAPGVVLAAPGLLHHALTRLAGPAPEVILASDRDLLARLRQLAKRIAPDLADRFELAEVRRPLALDEAIDAALDPVAAFDGGRLSIETTRAMTVIDVDGAGRPLAVNLQAVPEIARQLRLRRIGGPVAIDFISMSRAPDRKRVETALRGAIRPLRAACDGLNRFGIATLALPRERLSLAEQLTRAPLSAPVLKLTAQLARALRRAEFELAGAGPQPVVIELSERLRAAAPPDLAQRLSTAWGRSLSIGFGPRDIDDVGLTRE